MMKIIVGIASTTHIDKHRERMAKSALDGMAKKIKEEFIPLLVNHNAEQHIGAILYGETFQLKDGEYALGVVSGIFENPEERETFDAGQSNHVWKRYKKYFSEEKLLQLIDEKRELKKDMLILDKRESNIADLLETHLDSTQVAPDGTIYKIKRFIAATGDLRIEVYPKDHQNQPHFHVISRQRNIDARFSIDSLELISTKRGTISTNDKKRIINFFSIYPEKLKKLRNEHTRLN